VPDKNDNSLDPTK